MSEFIATNDVFIRELVKDKSYKIFKNGKILRYFKKYGYNQSLKWQKVYQGRTSSGYPVITYKGKKLPVHRVIYGSFRLLDSRKVINHKNHNKDDNRLVNLELITPRENSFYDFIKGKNKSSKLNLKVVRRIRKNFEAGISKDLLCKKYQISMNIVRRIIKNKTWVENKKIKKQNQKISSKRALSLLLKDSRYKINKDGTIYSNISGSFKKMKCKKQSFSYIVYKRKQIPIHRIIASKFISKISKGFVVNHIDGNQKNNHVDNLQIVTQKENMIHSSRVLKKVPKKIYSNKHVLEIKKLKEEGVRPVEISRRLGIPIRTLFGHLKRMRFGSHR